MKKVTAKVTRSSIITEETVVTVSFPDDERPSLSEIETKILASITEDTKFKTTYRNSKLSVIDVKYNNQPTLPIF